MKKFIVIFFFAVCAFNNSSAQDSTNTALLYGHNHSYYLSAPVGWIMDNSSGREQGMTSVFYPKGSSWTDGETVMYTTYINFDSTKNETIKDIITFDSAQFKTTSPKLKVSKEMPIMINKNKKAIVYSYSGDVNGNYESVAYIPEKKGVVMIVISSSNKNGCINNYKAFEALVRSYKFLTDKVNIE